MLYLKALLLANIVQNIFVDNNVIVELKAVKAIIPVFEVQLVNYLKATGIEVGLLINFGKKLEVKRKVFSAIIKIILNLCQIPINEEI
jgi:GxxExxY protein